MKKIAVTCSFIFIATVSYAEPVYLECAQNGKEVKYFSVTIDENIGEITYDQEGSGEVKKYKAFFSPTELKFQEKEMLDSFGKGFVETSITVEINRKDLSYIRTATWKWPEDNMPTVSITEGKCKIITIKDRKF